MFKTIVPLSGKPGQTGLAGSRWGATWRGPPHQRKGQTNETKTNGKRQRKKRKKKAKQPSDPPSRQSPQMFGRPSTVASYLPACRLSIHPAPALTTHLEVRWHQEAPAVRIVSSVRYGRHFDPAGRLEGPTIRPNCRRPPCELSAGHLAPTFTSLRGNCIVYRISRWADTARRKVNRFGPFGHRADTVRQRSTASSDRSGTRGGKGDSAERDVTECPPSP